MRKGEIHQHDPKRNSVDRPQPGVYRSVQGNAVLTVSVGMPIEVTDDEKARLALEAWVMERSSEKKHHGWFNDYVLAHGRAGKLIREIITRAQT